ncbi:SIMPL domain-containing protein [uncultured Tateyamaria sp.]|uniref:SIMPL domain-containing protein n=1 Tax=uncultured Tateyamaria sp. TaxID=455651 RepID=UPI00260A5889|nr:SIMPL domain-containing protein [uncultured Tateyamaria sp.]
MRSWMMAGIVTLAMTTAGLAQDATGTVSVVGEGQSTAVPDMAVISLGVTHSDASAKAAMDRVSADARALLGVLEAFGVMPRDVQTEQVGVQPLWNNDHGHRHIAGYVARNGVSVRVRDLSQLGAVIDAALNVGSNDFGGVQFQLSDPAPAMAEARAAAVRDARARASQMAEAAEVALGPIVTMSEAGAGGRPEMFAAARSADVPIASGEVSVTARVAVTFGLLP